MAVKKPTAKKAAKNFKGVRKERDGQACPDRRRHQHRGSLQIAKSHTT
jgi:hypothetical protein